MRAGLVAALAILPACALIDASKSDDKVVPLSCVGHTNGCVCDVEVPPATPIGTCSTATPVADSICCVDGTGKCACAVPACFDDAGGACLCGVFADPGSFGFTPAVDNRCPADAGHPVCCEAVGSDFPSCQCGPQCSATETNIGAVCLPSHVTNCGALRQVESCQ